MANPDHLVNLRRGSRVWNAWRHRAGVQRPDLSGAHLHGAHLREANLNGADLSRALLSDADLTFATLRGADLSRAFLNDAHLEGADLTEANLSEVQGGLAHFNRATLDRVTADKAFLDNANLLLASLIEATFTNADLRRADLTGANCTRANFAGANLEGARLVEANLAGANITGCRVYGTSVWNVLVDDDTTQADLIITRSHDPRMAMMSAEEAVLHVDRLEVAQFVYLLLDNPKLRDVIETVGRKAVLILGRFTPERKDVLDAVRDALRQRDYVPILFDFQGPANRDTHETVMSLAHLARFIIADVTDPKSIPQELATIVPSLPSVPVQPLLLAGSEPWGMYDHISRFPWVLPLHRYRDLADLLASLEDGVIAPAEARAAEGAPKQG